MLPTGCSRPIYRQAANPAPSPAAGKIIETATGQAITFASLIAKLADVSIVYIGEQHTNPAHHAAQLAIIRQLSDQRPKLQIGMEMFDRSYQSVLDSWLDGQLTEQEFIENSHWYANWRYDFDLYKPILTYARQRRLPIVALNIPPHIPPKIASGGLASLSSQDSAYLPAQVNTHVDSHRDYVQNIFDHHHIRGRNNFTYFYQAQCVWEDTMVVLAGNGHIIYKFGIPNRVYALAPVNFKTIYTTTSLSDIKTDNLAEPADYIWIGNPIHPAPKDNPGNE